MASAAKLEQMLRPPSLRFKAQGKFVVSTHDLLWPSYIHLFLAVHIAHKAQMKVLLASIVLFSRVQHSHEKHAPGSPALACTSDRKPQLLNA
ncbi:hypothetical protein F383_07848 [Gossypium arboreum]|uniref:Uncharacterized protein n=1 Tax=Gossypium arboreum TaxID=29729 RepID=A0A0B0PEF8_GOSAR|nr:hypothetical protein F383_07848 [Gossypium arboreum]